MKKAIRTRRFLWILVVMALAFATVAGTLVVASADSLTAQRFQYSDVKYKMAQEAPASKYFSSDRKGLLLSAYDSGASAMLKGTFQGKFEAELKASTLGTSSPDLRAWSLVFEDIVSGEKFALTIEDNGTEYQAYVRVGEDKAGVSYNTWDNSCHGYTTMQNQSGVYTKVIATGVTKVGFDPATMQVTVQNDVGQTLVVWDMTKRIMDGKAFNHVLSPMSHYTVTVEFTTVSAGKKGELTIYSINGEDYGAVNMPLAKPTVYTNAVHNAVVGAAYTLPVPGVYDADGKLTVNDVAYEIYNDAGKKLASGSYAADVSFTPDKTGNYYIYYVLTGAGGQKGEFYGRFKAYKPENLSCTFGTAALQSGTYGQNTALVIPERSVNSNLFADGQNGEAVVTLYKDGKALADYTDVKPGFTYTFSETGAYKVVYSSTPGGRRYEADPIEIQVSDQVAGVVMENLPETAYTGDAVTIPEATVYLGGESGKATHTVILPDGTRLTDASVTLELVGNYTVEYSYNVGGTSGTFTRSFVAQRKVEDIFTSSDKATVVYDPERLNADYPGVVVTMTANSSYVSCDVDLSDNTKNDTLIDLMAAANTLGVRDCNGFYVTLTDKLDRTNYVTIRVHTGSGNASNGSFIKAKASNQTAYTAWYKLPDWNGGQPFKYTNQLETAMAHNYGGFLTQHSFGTSTLSYDFDFCMIKLKWDTAEKALYANNDLVFVATEDQNEHLVVDFDDPACFPSLWTGFTDDSQVELTITPIAVSGSASFKIFAIDNQKLNNQTVQDVTGPVLKLDLEGMTAVPDAKIGMAYKLFNVIATDDLSSADMITTTVSVTYGNTPVEVKDGAFVPDRNGYYTIIYVATDSYGNETTLKTEVYARSDISGVSATLTGTWAPSAEYGYPVTLPTYSGKGGSGRYLRYATVEHKGETVKVTDGVFTPMDEGEYVVTLYLEDYLGQKATISHTYNVTFKSQFVLDPSQFILPPAFIDGSAYVFDEYIAGYYPAVGSEMTMVPAKIQVEDAEGTRYLGEDRTYIPKAGGASSKAIIRFIFQAEVNGKTIENVVEKTAAIRTINQEAGFLANYFLLENAAATAKNQYITFQSVNTGKDVAMTFLRPISMDTFDLEMKPTSMEGVFLSNYEAIRVTLTDRYDPNIRVELTIRKNGDELQLLVNGENPLLMMGSVTVDSTLNLRLAYNNSNFALLGVENSALGTIKQTVSGEPFKGFPSGEAYMSIELVGVTGDAAINLIAINNQRFFNTVRDTGAPQIFVDGSYSGMYVSGTQITLPSARAYDVLNAVAVPTLTVIGPDGNYVTAQDGTVLNAAPANKTYVIAPSGMGRYSVSYQAADDAGQRTNVEKSIVIYDDVAPEVQLNAALPERVWTGAAVTIPGYTIKDNGDASKVTVSLFYRDPDGIIHNVENNQFTATIAGEYVIIFYMVDENGAYNTQTFTVKAIAKAE